MALKDADYRRWLKAAYQYYWGDGSDMSDHEWDHLGRQINPDDHDELRGTEYVPGQSLYWLPKASYPDWAKE
jgi:hypothetical protein